MDDLKGRNMKKPAQPARRPGQPPKRRKKKNKLLPIVLTLLFIVVVGGIFVYMTFGKSYTPTYAVGDLNGFFGLTQADQLAVIVDAEIQEYQGKMIEGTAYVDYETARLINPKVYLDMNERLMLYSTPDENIAIQIDATSYKKEGSTVSLKYKVVTLVDDTYYVALPFLEKMTNMVCNTYENPNRVVVTSSEEPIQVARVEHGCEVREKADSKSMVMANLTVNEQVQVLEPLEGQESGDYTRIMTRDGLIGYIKTKHMTATTSQDMKRTFEEPVYSNRSLGGPVHMAWHQTMNQSSNDWLPEAIANVQGLNVISPTWYFLVNTQGDIAGIANSNYVETCHNEGIQVWATINDFDGQEIYGGPNSSEETLDLLSHTSRRWRLEQTLIGDILANGIDGLNVDFERINEECGPHYIQFIRELSIMCRQNGIFLAVDSYVPSAWTYQYNREEVGEIADYVVIMCYDEYGSWSDEIGPNASFTYTETAINDITKIVDPGKVIIGLPFYTRIWEIKQMEGGNGVEFTCTTNDMMEVQNAIESAGAEITFDEVEGEHFAKWVSGEYTYKVWIEDSDSLKTKLDYMKKNGIAGYGCWKLTQETADVWDVLSQY